MTNKTILLDVFQPFAQYRNPFTFYYAQSYPLPPKSTIIGMLQNATGRYYDPRFWDIKVSVHGGFESYFWNYQNLIKGDVTVERYKGGIRLWNQNLPLYGRGRKSQRSPVSQQELFNGHLYIFLRGEENLIEEIARSLLNPKKVLYLGRSEDVIFINKIYSERELQFTAEPKEIRKNMWLTYPTYIMRRNFPIKNEKFPVYSIPTKVVFENNGRIIENKAELTKATERKPEFTSVIYTGVNYVVHLEDPVDEEKLEVPVNEGKLIFKIASQFGWL